MKQKISQGIVNCWVHTRVAEPQIFLSSQTLCILQKKLMSKRMSGRKKKNVPEENVVNEKGDVEKKTSKRPQEYQSYLWGSNGIKNSCFIDSLLEVMFQVWSRQKKNMLPETLEESLVERREKNFHTSKMVLWKFLKEHAINNYDTFNLGEMGAITAVIECLYSNIPNHERSHYYLLNETRTKCLTNDNHNRQRLSHYPLFYLYHKYITFDHIDESNHFDVCSLVEFV